MFRRILTNAIIAAIAVIVGGPLIVTAWFYIGGIETASLPDDADLIWTPPVVADEDNAFVAILATTNLINCATLGTNSWGKVDMSFVSGYANINTNRDSTARRIRADPGAGGKADRILAGNEAFYAAFAKGLERKGFRNTLPPISKEVRFSMLPFHVMGSMSNLWRLKIQREMERGEWSAAVSDVETLHRFGRVVSDNAATIVDLMVGNSIEGMVSGKIQDLASCGELTAIQLARFAELVDADAKAEPENVSRIIKAEYSLARAHLDLMSPEYVLSLVGFTFSTANKLKEICKKICSKEFGVSVSEGSSLDRVAECLVRTVVSWPGYFRYTFHRKTTQKRLADVAHKALRGEIDDSASEDGSIFSRNGIGRTFVRNLAFAYQQALVGKDRLRPVFARARTQLVVAASRWRLDHGGEMPPTQDALVPQYLPAVPLDPWSKDGKPFSYDAAAGVVWSVGESGDFDYSKLPAGESKLVRGKIGRNVDYYAFRLDGKPLTLMDNAKCTLPPQAGQEEKGGDHANIERFIAFQKRRCPEIKDADIGKAIILLGAPLYVCTYFKNGGQHETFDFSADDKRYYVDKFVLGNEPVKQALQKLLMDEPAKEIPENAFQAFIQLGLEEKFNSQYQERLHSDRSDLHIDTDEGQLSIMLRESGCTNGAMTPYTQSDAHYGVPCASVVLASCDGGEIFSVASALDNKDSGLYLSTMFSRDMKSYSVGVVFADSLLRRIPHKSRLHVHVPGHGIVSFNLYNVGYRVRHDCHSKLPQ